MNLSAEGSAYARNTWRYLRLAMVGVLVGLGASVLIEHLKVGSGCFQTSISAYYYTPVRGVFVGALVSLGVCMICLRGSTDLEDLLLNLAGMLAFVVAFVPTPKYKPSCTSAHALIEHVTANVANNIVALLIVSGIALLIVNAILVSREATRIARVGGAVGAFLWGITLVTFLAARGAFLHNAHNVAASALFLCIVSAAVDNALDTERKAMHVLYVSLASAMVVAMAVILLVGLLARWHYWTILLEVVVLALFATFWVAQTADLWGTGIRPRLEGKRDPSPKTRLLPRLGPPPE